MLMVLSFLVGLMTAAGLSPEAAKILHVYGVFASVGIHPRKVAPIDPSVGNAGTAALPREVCVVGSESDMNCSTRDPQASAPPSKSRAQKPASAASQTAAARTAPDAHRTAHDVLKEIEAMDKAHQQPARAAKSGLDDTQPAVLAGTGGIDPKAEERIMKMAIPGEMKKEILERYRRTGILPPQLQK
jgi:hypothetical protein